MPDQRLKVTGLEVEAEPEGNSQAKQLACYEVHLRWGEKRRQVRMGVSNAHMQSHEIH